MPTCVNNERFVASEDAQMKNMHGMTGCVTFDGKPTPSQAKHSIGLDWTDQRGKGHKTALREARVRHDVLPTHDALDNSRKNKLQLSCYSHATLYPMRTHVLLENK